MKEVFKKYEIWNPIYLNVPFSQKNDAKLRGAKWDYLKSKWYVNHSQLKSGHLDPWIENKSGELSNDFLKEKNDIPSVDKQIYNDEIECKSPSTMKSKNEESKIKDDRETEFIIIFDLETNGLPKKKDKYSGEKSSEDEKKLDFSQYDSARVVQLCYTICNLKDLSSVNLKNFIIKADNFGIDNHNIHGITLERSLSEGVPIKDVFNEITVDFLRAKYLCAHNIEFDLNVLKSELYRYENALLFKHIETMKHICSMKTTKFVVNALSKTNSIKNPKLSELYKFATGREMINQHDAKYDVLNLHEAIKILYEQKKITLI